MASKVVTGKN